MSGKSLERLGEGRSLQGDRDHGIHVPVHALRLARAAPQHVQVRRKRHPFRHFGGDPGAAGAQIAVQGAQPKASPDARGKAHGNHRNDDQREGRRQQPQHDERRRDQNERRDQARQAQRQPVAERRHVADETQRHVARAPFGYGAGRHAGCVVEQRQPQIAGVVLAQRFALPTREHAGDRDDHAREHQNAQHPDRQPPAEMHRVEQPTRREGRGAGPCSLQQGEQRHQRQAPQARSGKGFGHRRHATSGW